MKPTNPVESLVTVKLPLPRGQWTKVYVSWSEFCLYVRVEDGETQHYRTARAGEFSTGGRPFMVKLDTDTANLCTVDGVFSIIGMANE